MSEEEFIPSVASVHASLKWTFEHGAFNGKPARISMTGDRGISFEWEYGDALKRIEFFADGSKEFSIIKGSQVTFHHIQRAESKTPISDAP